MSKCVCNSETGGCDEGCLNYITKYECNESNCNVGVQHCNNRGFTNLPPLTKKGVKSYGERVEVIDTGNRGCGIRATRSFKPNQIIIEYTGEIITQYEANSRINQGKKVS